MSIENVCRLCGLKLSLSQLKTIKELKNEQMDLLIFQYLKIKITEINEFPTTACKICCKVLYDFDQFCIKVKATQQKFQSTFSNSDIKIENELNLYCNEIDSNYVKTEDDYGKQTTFNGFYFFKLVIIFSVK